VGEKDGEKDGYIVGENDGENVGDTEGDNVGEFVGDTEGENVGESVGGVGDLDMQYPSSMLHSSVLHIGSHTVLSCKLASHPATQSIR
jgi:hypothetical protein